MENHYWGKGSKSRMDGVHPILVEWATRVLKRSKYDLTCPWMGGLRTTEEQYELFKKGYSKCDGTNKKSYHQSSYAIDLVISAKTIEGMYDVKKLDYLSEIGFLVWEEMAEAKLTDGYTLEWGGHWRSFVDKPHWQLVKR